MSGMSQRFQQTRGSRSGLVWLLAMGFSAGALLVGPAKAIAEPMAKWVTPVQQQQRGVREDDVRMVIMFTMARDVDDRCRILSNQERARLNGFIEYGMARSGLDADQQALLRSPNPENNDIRCDDPLVSMIFSRLRAESAPRR